MLEHCSVMPDTLEALAEPHRRRILDVLRGGEASVGSLVDVLNASQPLVSKHLRVLREAGLVSAAWTGSGGSTACVRSRWSRGETSG
jgi:DNA-binding transcriptional ArsR family regulator